MFGLSKVFKKADPIKMVCNNTNFFDVMSKDLNEAKEKMKNMKKLLVLVLSLLKTSF